MAIVDLTFNNVQIVEGANNATINGTVAVDYTAGTVTGSLTTLVDGAHSLTFTSFILTPVGVNDYVVDSPELPNDLTFGYASQTPTDLLGAAVADASAGLTISSPPGSLSGTVCFAAGTLIRTPRGDVPVETLKIGDLVLIASGEMRPVKWMGHRDVDFRLTPKASPGLPIRIAADAFGPSRPSQDLYLSSGHSVCVDLLGEVFIPVGHLVNGASIAEVEVEAISYWHVELDSHDILIANNLPAESYLAIGNRGAFEERRGLLRAMLEGRERTHADFCRPVVTEGPVLDFVRQRLVVRAEEIGWMPSRDADLRLMVDGEIIRPSLEGSVATFAFSTSAKDVRLLSSAFSPMSLGVNDPRVLGVMLSGLAFGDNEVALDDQRLRDGVLQLENHGGEARRWTNGELVLDPQFWDGLSGDVSLRVTCDLTTVRGWTAPPTVRKTAPVGRPMLHTVG